MGGAVAIAGLLAFAPCGARAQAFEVASIRLNKTGIRGGSADFPRGGERFTATNMPFGALVLIAYNVTVRQLSGPGDFLSEKYDVAAKAGHAAGPDEMRRMLQALLADRFKLAIRRETKEVPVYALTVGKGGAKLRRSDSPEGWAEAPRTPSGAGGIEPSSGRLVFKNESMGDFAWALSRMAGFGDRVVVDHTGLKGRYDFELTFERNRAAQESGIEDPPIFSAIEEELGLKLESTKRPVEFLIVEHVEWPSEN